MDTLLWPPLRGIHHLKIAVSDLDRSLDFYARALGAQRLEHLDHRRVEGGELYAVILDVPDIDPKIELRLDSAQASKHHHFDPITLAVADRKTLFEWKAYLEAMGVSHSPVITAIQAWLIVVEDPDGNRIRLYTLEGHGSELKPDEDNSWIR